MENKNIHENKKIDLEIDGKKEIDGKIIINYTGRFDSISINSQIEDSSDVFTFVEIDNKKINHPYARLSIFKKEIKDPKIIKFKAFTNHIPKNNESSVKFRATLIQEHKEIASDVKFTKINR
ncbi:MAG TPA: hypothetical protein VN703_06470 [Candidatus Sulfopaludibacter sp.]|jgi:hypothetical protein|nr:hypothetical protein [Candidatus Sulfopaludibacter sp.]